MKKRPIIQDDSDLDSQYRFEGGGDEGGDDGFDFNVDEKDSHGGDDS